MQFSKKYPQDLPEIRIEENGFIKTGYNNYYRSRKWQPIRHDIQDTVQTQLFNMAAYDELRAKHII